jgi:hypothetical protein
MKDPKLKSKNKENIVGNMKCKAYLSMAHERKREI